MQFRSEINLPPSEHPFGHGDKVVALGSCFAGRMGQRLVDYKFSCLVNPFGIVYHPDPLLRALTSALKGDSGVDSDLIEFGGKWHSFLFHSDLSHASHGFVKQAIQQRRKLLQASLLQSQRLILTFGTALGFRHRERDEIVANNHKFPASNFTREMGKLDALLYQLSEFLSDLWAANPQVRVILTVSPVRHLRSGMVENSASKAILRALCHEISQTEERVDYFPAFEIMMDDLRDYRFYQDDLMHPTKFAEQYIWGQFSSAYLQPQSREWMEKVDRIQRDMAHRPFDPGSESHHDFLLALKSKIEALNLHLDMGLELAEVSERLADFGK